MRLKIPKLGVTPTNADTGPAHIPLTEKQIVQQVLEKKRAAEYAFQPLFDMWEMNWKLYHGKVDFQGKLPWQSRQVCTDLYSDTERAATLMTKSLQQPGEWFSVQMQDVYLEWIFQSWLKHYLDEADYAIRFKEALRNGLLSALMIHKIYSGGSAAPLRIKTINPDDFRIDPSGLKTWVAEITRIKKSALEAQGIYQHLDRLKDRIPKVDDYKWEQRGQMATVSPNARRGEVSVIEYWGNLENSQGDTVGRNLVCAVGNEDQLIRLPEDNPLLHRKPPYIVHSFVSIPGMPIGKSLAESEASTILLISEAMNLLVDGSMLEALKVFIANTGPGGIDPAALKEGIKPGMILEQAIPSPTPPLVPLNLGFTSAQALLPLIGILDKGRQRTSSITDPIQGLTPGKKGTTATEIAQATSGAMGLYDGYAAEVEAGFLSPGLEMALYTLMENVGAIEDPFLEKKLSTLPKDPQTGRSAYEILRTMQPEEALNMIKGQSKIKAHGMSSVIARTQNMQMLVQLMGILKGMPQFADHINERVFLEKLLDAAGGDSSDMLRSQQEVEQIRQKRQQEQMQMLQMQAQLKQGGGNGSGPRPAGSPAPSIGGAAPPQPPSLGDLLQGAGLQ